MRVEHLLHFHGTPAVRLCSPDGATAVVLLHGAHVVSWQPAGGDERLFLSARSRFDEGASVRGGIPVVFPQFSERGPLPRHGFVRTRPWQLARAEVGSDDALAVLQLDDDVQTRALWPHAFWLELTVCVRGQRLDVELSVNNRGGSDLEFAAALHTYLRADEIEAVRLSGLRGCRYEDMVGGGNEVEAADTLRVDREIDRIYFEASGSLRLTEGRRRLRIEAERLPDTVVWNPWRQRSASMVDLDPEDFRRFLCVEAALIGQPVALAPGGEWSGRQSLIVD